MSWRRNGLSISAWQRARLRLPPTASPGRSATPKCHVRSYQPIEAQMPGTDPDDKVHVAAAVAGAVTHIVTEDKSGGSRVKRSASSLASRSNGPTST